MAVVGKLDEEEEEEGEVVKASDDGSGCELGRGGKGGGRGRGRGGGGGGVKVATAATITDRLSGVDPIRLSTILNSPTAFIPDIWCRVKAAPQPRHPEGQLLLTIFFLF